MPEAQEGCESNDDLCRHGTRLVCVLLGAGWTTVVGNLGDTVSHLFTNGFSAGEMTQGSNAPTKPEDLSLVRDPDSGRRRSLFRLSSD